MPFFDLVINITASVFISPEPKANFLQVYVEHSVKGRLKIYINGHGPFIKMRPCPYMVKTLKNLLLQNQESFKAEFWYIVSWTQVLLSLFK